MKALLTIVLLEVASVGVLACGLDWTLPTNHFDGVNEYGYVSYWEKIGEASLGDGLTIPVHINFDSHREANSPYLGKGWLVALLESHVEPVDENCLRVIMPDGWTFTFLRNGSTETWRGNAGWVGETSDTILTITAPCGWRVKFDGGKIQEIDTDKNRVLTYRYNGGVATEVDEGGKPFVVAESTTSTGAITDLLIGGERVDITLGRRPQVVTKLTQNLIIGFDSSLSELKFQNGKVETFEFGTDKSLDPTLGITHTDQTKRNFTWDPSTKRIVSDGQWTYSIPVGDLVAAVPITRKNTAGQSEYYEDELSPGIEIKQALDGITTKYTRFTSGALRGKFRKIEISKLDQPISVETFSYNETGDVIRYINNGVIHDYLYDQNRNMIKETVTNTSPLSSAADVISQNGGADAPMIFSENLQIVKDKTKIINYKIDPQTNTLIIPN